MQCVISSIAFNSNEYIEKQTIVTVTVNHSASIFCKFTINDIMKVKQIDWM